MDYQKAKPMIRTSVLISPEFYELSRKYGIKFSEALRTGISLILAERGFSEYDNKLNLMRKMDLVRSQLEAKSIELEKLKETKSIKKAEITDDGFQVV